jgi:hypothetical protein
VHVSVIHRLNMELDLQIYLGSCVKLYSLAETPQLPSSPRIWAHKRGRLLVSLDRRHLFRTPGLITCMSTTAFITRFLKRCLCQFSIVVFLFCYACKHREEPQHAMLESASWGPGCGFSVLNLCYRHQVILGYITRIHIPDVHIL